MRKFKTQISPHTDNQKWGKSVATNENCILRKMGLKSNSHLLKKCALFASLKAF